MTTDTTHPLVSGMRAETGFEPDDSAPPLRISGFLCLFFGLLSFFCTMGQPLLVMPVIAVIFGLFALRPSDQTPVGTRPAMLGLLMAAGFGACGLALPWMKTRTLGKQAEQFSRYYMEVVARGHDAIAMELQKDYVNRFSDTMSLEKHYASSERAMEMLEEHHHSSFNVLLRRRGPDAEWVLDRPVRIYYSYGREHAEVVWMDPTGEVNAKLQMFLDYRVDRNGDGQWNVDVAQEERQLVVAESVL